MIRALRIVVVAGVLGLLLLPAAGATAAPSCQPGSGTNLAGRHLDAAALDQVKSLQCADLSGADLSGVDLTQKDLSGVKAEKASFRNARLIQADLPGADLKGADFSGADLTQATLTGADLTGANLAGATIDQVEAGNVNLTDANLTNVHATQAGLTGATLDGAKVDGGDFTQAELGHASLHNVKGLTNWSQYLLIGAVAVFVLLGALVVRRALGRRAGPDDAPAVPAVPATPVSPWATPGFGTTAVAAAPTATAGFNPINRRQKTVGRGITVGLLGALLVALGLHLLVGGSIGEFSFAFDTLATHTCSGPTCPVGVNSGIVGLIGGAWVMVAGFFVMARA